MAAGHGGKSGRFQRYHQVAMEYAFLFDQLGILPSASDATATESKMTNGFEVDRAH